MVGMPYPNIKSPELQEKMTYLDKHMVRHYCRSYSQTWQNYFLPMSHHSDKLLNQSSLKHPLTFITDYFYSLKCQYLTNTIFLYSSHNAYMHTVKI